MPARMGLGGLSLLFIIILAVFSDVKSALLNRHTRTRHVPMMMVADMIITGLIFVLGYFLSAQLYYFYYLFLFPDISLQWVVPGFSRFIQSLSKVVMMRIDNLAQLTAGIGFWFLMVNTFYRQIRKVSAGWSLRHVAMIGLLFLLLPTSSA